MTYNNGDDHPQWDNPVTVDDLPSFDELSEWDAAVETIAYEFDLDGDLATQLTEYIDERAGVFDVVAFYQEHGRLRDTTPLSADAMGRVDRLLHNPEPQQCYYNAQMAVTGATADDVVYVEGYVASAEAPAPIPHAWVEADGAVAEITLPGGRHDSGVYYGVAYHPRTVRRALTERERAAPLAEAPDTYPPLEETNEHE